MADAACLGTGRKIVVAAIAAVISLGSLVCIALDVDLWPWSNYPMYREVQGNQLRYRQAFAVLQDGSEVQFTNEQARPYAATRLNQVLRRFAKRPDGEKRMARVLAQLTSQARSRGSTDQVIGARAYEMRWTLKRGARNRDRPDRRELLAEFLLPEWSKLATTRPASATAPAPADSDPEPEGEGP
jgi:hypothetical protein